MKLELKDGNMRENWKDMDYTTQKFTKLNHWEFPDKNTETISGGKNSKIVLFWFLKYPEMEKKTLRTDTDRWEKEREREREW